MARFIFWDCIFKIVFYKELWLLSYIVAGTEKITWISFSCWLFFWEKKKNPQSEIRSPLFCVAHQFDQEHGADRKRRRHSLSRLVERQKKTWVFWCRNQPWFCTSYMLTKRYIYCTLHINETSPLIFNQTPAEPFSTVFLDICGLLPFTSLQTCK